MSTDRTTEILNYLTAISRDVGELRAEVKQLGTQLAQVEARLTQVETQPAQTNERLEGIEREQKRQGGGWIASKVWYRLCAPTLTTCKTAWWS